MIPKKVAVGDRGICSFPMRSLMLASLLLTLLFVNKTACDLYAEILKPFADKNLAVLLSCFCMRVVIALEEDY